MLILRTGRDGLLQGGPTPGSLWSNYRKPSQLIKTAEREHTSPCTDEISYLLLQECLWSALWSSIDLVKWQSASMCVINLEDKLNQISRKRFRLIPRISGLVPPRPD